MDTLTPSGATDQRGRAHIPPRMHIDKISKSFGDTQALSDVSFDLMPGEIHALVGENGAGKSTLIKIITGYQEPDGGALELDGTPVSFGSTLEARRAGVAAVYQDPALFPQLTIAENIFAARYPMRHGKVDKAAMRRETQRLMDDLGFDLNPDMTVAELSVAQCEYVEIARALSSDLKLLILDEPTSSLTPKEANELYQVVRNLRERHGTTVVWISHRMEEVHKLADTVTIMRDGKHVLTCPVSQISDDQMISQMVGRELAHVARDAAGDMGEVILEVNHLSANKLFDDVSFSVRAGEIVGIAGLVGAGRSEVGQAIFGLVPNVRGTITLHGTRISRLSTSAIVREGLVYLPEDRDREGIVTEMPVGANIALPSINDLAKAGIRNLGKEKKLVGEQIANLEIKAHSDDLVASLSGGNKQKVALGRWLGRKPQVLILDEPTHGIDVGTKAEVHSIVRKLAREEGRAIVLISSDMPELLAMSDRIVVMCRGRVTAKFDANKVTQEEIMAAAVGATDSLVLSANTAVSATEEKGR